jgi:hypothetical protein
MDISRQRNNSKDQLACPLLADPSIQIKSQRTNHPVQQSKRTQKPILIQPCAGYVCLPVIRPSCIAQRCKENAYVQVGIVWKIRSRAPSPRPSSASERHLKFRQSEIGVFAGGPQPQPLLRRLHRPGRLVRPGPDILNPRGRHRPPASLPIRPATALRLGRRPVPQRRLAGRLQLDRLVVRPQHVTVSSPSFPGRRCPSRNRRHGQMPFRKRHGRRPRRGLL